MTFQSRWWFPVAVALSAINVAAVYFAALPAEPLHATGHATLAVLFGLWAQRLWSQRGGGGGRARATDIDAALEPLALDVDQLRSQLLETQERLDFAERMLTQRRIDD